MKTLAAALSIALAAAGGALIDPAGADASVTGGATSKANWTSHATLRKPSYAFLRSQFAALHQSAKPPAQNRASTTRFISNSADTGSGSLREALATAVDGDIIDLTHLHGTLNLESSLRTDAMVEIRGPGRNALTIDAGHADRAFTASNGLRMSHVTVANGSAPNAVSSGGCLFVDGNLYLADVSLTGCTAGDATTPLAYGGAIAVDGELYLQNVSVTASSVTGYVVAAGGGVSVIGNTTDGYYVGIYNSTVSGNSAIVAENEASYLATGGGISVLGSKDPVTNMAYTTIAGSTISGNMAVNQTTYQGTYSATAQGGGANLQGSIATIEQSNVIANSISANQVTVGAGLSTSSPISMSGSTLSSNSSVGYIAYGGGVFAGGTITIDRSQIQANTVKSNFIAVGGGVFSYAPTTITNSSITGNTLDGTGGAVTNGGGVARKYSNSVGPASMMLTNSTISGNSAGGAMYDTGGGVYEYQSLTADNSTIANNNADGYGGGVTTNAMALITLNSTIIANNTAGVSDSADLYGYGGPITVAGDHNLVIASDSGVTLPGDTLTSDPKLLPLADNGGGTLTQALDPASPAVDAGSNPLSLTTDQRGVPYARVVGAGPDIGAYELDTDHIFGNGFE
ncbi:MAG TPA: choice-of-anchor Q domain-containing protein [Rudaea sp.]|nr:choice-of-anchor Q domain-containing protein [Rudaea sp.]